VHSFLLEFEQPRKSSKSLAKKVRALVLWSIE
jgi:hypothetical protein